MAKKIENIKPIGVAAFFATFNRSIKITSRLVGQHVNLVEDNRWYASIENVTIKGKHNKETCYTHVVGDGSTPATALENFVEQVSGKIVTLSDHDWRVHIDISVPKLTA